MRAVLKEGEYFARGFFLNMLTPDEWIESGNPDYGSQEALEALLHFRWDSWHVIGFNDHESHDAEHCSYCDRGGAK